MVIESIKLINAVCPGFKTDEVTAVATKGFPLGSKDGGMVEA
jgi:hypothetical protein